MWSAWRERVDVYLMRGMAVAKPAGQAAVRVEYPATLPLPRALARLESIVASNTNLHIALSAALCPAVGFTVPAGVTQWAEIMELARESATASLSAGAEQLACEIDAWGPGVAAAMPAPILDEVRQWAVRRDCRIAAIQPMWSLAMQTAEARHSSVTALLVREADGATMLADTGQGRLAVATVDGTGSREETTARFHRWTIAAGIQQAVALSLEFTVQPATKARRGWAHHWSVA